MAKVESIARLRQICQDPVRHYNDLPGLLYGWRLSIYVTRLLLGLGRSAAFASSLMLICGVAGSLCLAGTGWLRPAGLGLIAFSYVLDCVDGEMARYQKIDSYRWAATDYLYHLLTKGLSFLCLGIGLYREYGSVWTLAAGGTVSIFWLLLSSVRDLPTALFCKKIVLNPGRSGNPAYVRMVTNLGRNGTADAVPAKDPFGADFELRPWVVRYFLASYDTVVPVFLSAAIADRFIHPIAVYGYQLPLSTILCYAYAVLLPVHTIDVIDSAMRRGKVRDELYELARHVERFREKP